MSPSPHRPLVVANWKMYLSAEESLRVAEQIKKLVARSLKTVDMVLCPAFPVLFPVGEILEKSEILLGAQDVHEEEKGPHTGDVSLRLLPSSVRCIIVGHSERRREHREDDTRVARKARRVLRSGITPIVCVGETAEEHERGTTFERIRAQVDAVLEGLPVLDVGRLVIAYEPVWAISAGPGEEALQPKPQDVAEIVAYIRRLVSDHSDRRYVDKLRILYGGSITAKTVKQFVCEPGVDGVLAGGASTQPAECAAIVQEVAACRS